MDACTSDKSSAGIRDAAIVALAWFTGLRRLGARLGSAQATVATAHAIARVVFRMLKYQVEYEPLNVNKYQKRYEEQQIKYRKKKAAKFGFQLAPVSAVS